MKLNIPSPNAKQRQFLKATARYIAYGGSRGGGKSWAIRVKVALLALFWPGIKILILRRTYPDLIKNHIEPLRNLLEPLGAVYKDKDKTLWINHGRKGKSQIIFGYCDNDNDLRRYHGNEYDIICIDEATQFMWDWFDRLKGSVRGVNNFPKHIYLTCNPGDVGHAWVKRLFIDREFLPGENPDDYEFIAATVYDNIALMEKDPEYVKNLESLSDALRDAWLYGKWDSFIGQYFTEWRPHIHVVDPFPIPAHWRRYFSMDYGLDMLAAYCIAVSPEGQAYIYKEHYEPNLIISDAAQRIKALTDGEKIFQWFAPPDMWNRRQDTGKSVAEIFGESGIYLTKTNNERVAGWLNMKEWLKVREGDGGQYANMRFFRTCPNVIRSIPLLQFDQKHPSDAAGEPHEVTHAPDAIRYFCAGRPMAEPAAPVTKNVLPPALREVEDYTGGLINW